MPDRETDPLQRGALWQKTGPRGTWFSGTVDGKPCVVFKNPRYTEGSKLPAWIVFAPKPKEPAREDDTHDPTNVWGEAHRALLPDEEPPF